MITIIAGTNRENSETSNVSKYYAHLLKLKGENVQILDLSILPKDFLFSALYGKETDDFKAITEKYLFEVDKLVIVSPEYNGSYPGILKAFIDGWDPKRTAGKWVALVGVASGKQGNARGMDDLTNVLNYLQMNVIPVKPPISQIWRMFNEEKHIVDEGINKLINQQIELLTSY